MIDGFGVAIDGGEPLEVGSRHTERRSAVASPPSPLLRAPITSVLNGAKLGLTVFVDAGKVWDVGSSMDAAPWRRGAGAGVFLIASIVRINLDVARGLKTGDTRVHLSSGFTF